MLKKDRNIVQSINFWVMVRDVLVASINKGQLPIALVGIIFMIMILKMPPKDVSFLMFEILGAVKLKFYVGYVLAGAFLSFWFIHVKWQRNIFTREVERITDERNKLQERLGGGGSVESSDR